MKRWHATIVYRAGKHSRLTTLRELGELSELHDLVESGPHFDTVIEIEVTRINHVVSRTLTVEQAEKL